MAMGRAIAMLVLAAFPISAAPSDAGNNFGGTATLSWSSVAQITDRSNVPTAPVPLYLILDGVPDLRSLAVEVKWLPNSLVGPCYYLLPTNSATGACASTSYLDPPGVFDGDSSYDWKITFSGPSHACVQYTVAGDLCDGKAASFCLASVRTLDSDGAIDELGVLGGATILGGVPDGCPVVAEDVFPHVAVVGRENTFTIQGRALSPNTQITLVDDGVTANASSVVVTGDTTATATVPIPSSFAGALDVVVTTPSSSDTLANRVVAADSSAGMAPVWQLDVAQSQDLPRASVVANEFTNPAYTPAFPATMLPIKHRTESMTMSGDHMVPMYSMDIAPLGLDVNGQPVVNGLAFATASAVSVNQWSGKISVLSPVAPSGGLPIVPTRLSSRTVRLDVKSTDANPFLGWERSPNEGWSVARNEHEMSIFTAQSPTPTLRLSGLSYAGVFSRNGKVYATVIEDVRGRRWAALSRDGVISESKPTGDALNQLELSPSGDVLTFSRQRTVQDPAVTVGVNLASGEERVLANIPNGTRYYSDDGRTMALLQPYPGRLQLFDVTDPLNPVEIAPALETSDGDFISAAVSADGGLVALQLLETTDNPHRTLSRVVALDRSLQQRALVIAGTSLSGLQFQGRYLLVGTQRHPIPSYFIFNPTTQIRLYDLGSL